MARLQADTRKFVLESATNLQFPPLSKEGLDELAHLHRKHPQWYSPEVGTLLMVVERLCADRDALVDALDSIATMKPLTEADGMRLARGRARTVLRELYPRWPA